jgi:hypothetical protein
MCHIATAGFDGQPHYDSSASFASLPAFFAARFSAASFFFSSLATKRKIREIQPKF